MCEKGLNGGCGGVCLCCGGVCLCVKRVEWGCVGNEQILMGYQFYIKLVAQEISDQLYQNDVAYCK